MVYSMHTAGARLLAYGGSADAAEALMRLVPICDWIRGPLDDADAAEAAVRAWLGSDGHAPGGCAKGEATVCIWLGVGGLIGGATRKAGLQCICSMVSRYYLEDQPLKTQNLAAVGAGAVWQCFIHAVLQQR